VGKAVAKSAIDFIQVKRTSAGTAIVPVQAKSIPA
jgi:hypothetical protein